MLPERNRGRPLHGPSAMLGLRFRSGSVSLLAYAALADRPVVPVRRAGLRPVVERRLAPEAGQAVRLDERGHALLLAPACFLELDRARAERCDVLVAALQPGDLGSGTCAVHYFCKDVGAIHTS